LRDVEEMANRLFADRDASLVGKRWAINFVKRQPDLKRVFSGDMAIRELNVKI
jgi:hypothetical protein